MGDQVAKYLTEQDVEFLRELRRWHKSLPVNFGKADRFSRTINRSPEVYLAKTVDGQPIPARAGDVCGDADCWLYYLNSDLEPTKVEQDGVEAVVNVKNPRTTEVPSEDYFKITRDKFGHWFPDSPSSQLGVPFKNTSGYTIPPGGIMSPYSSLTVLGLEYVLCNRPDSDFHRRWLVNGQTPVEDGDFSLGSWLDDLSGFAAIDAGSQSEIGTTRGWGPQPGSFLLYPAWFGFTIPGVTTYTINGQLVAHARQHEVNYLIGVKLLETLEFNESAAARIWRRDSQGDRRETEFNPLEVFDGLKLRQGDEVVENTRLDIVWNGDAWELANAACTEEDEDQSQNSVQSSYGDSISSFGETASISSPSFPSM